MGGTILPEDAHRHQRREGTMMVTEREPEDEEHLEDLPDGSGCTEIWEHLSERRAEADDD